MPREKPNDFLRVRVTSRTRQVVAAWSEQTGMTQERLVGALVDHWTSKDEDERLQMLIGFSDEQILRRAEAIRRQREIDTAAGVELIRGAAAETTHPAQPAEKHPTHGKGRA